MSEASSWQEDISAREPEDPVLDPTQFPKIGDIVPSEENSLDEEKSSQGTVTSAGTGNMSSRRETIDEEGPPLSQDLIDTEKTVSSSHTKQDSSNTNVSTDSGSSTKGTFTTLP
jgi:hypothetical protein